MRSVSPAWSSWRRLPRGVDRRASRWSRASSTRAACRGLVDSAGRQVSDAFVGTIRPMRAERRELDAWCQHRRSRRAHSGPERPDGTAPVGRSRRELERSRGRRTTRAFIRDLRAGRLHERRAAWRLRTAPPGNIRSGASVPGAVPAGAPVPDRIGSTSPSGSRDDVVSVAEAEGLALLYVPSMRNGRDGSLRAEDRGNAILSTFDLSDPTGIELPFVHQRRVAVAATVSGAGPDQRPWRLRVVSVHLDASTGPRRLWLFTSAERERQVEHLVGCSATIRWPPSWVGTSTRGPAGRVSRRSWQLEREFPQAETGGRFARWLTLDYVFLRLPPSWRAESGPAVAAFGSDHRPILSPDQAWTVSSLAFAFEVLVVQLVFSVLRARRLRSSRTRGSPIVRS